jgi:hypothetical protein
MIIGWRSNGRGKIERRAKQQEDCANDPAENDVFLIHIHTTDPLYLGDTNVRDQEWNRAAIVDRCRG